MSWTFLFGINVHKGVPCFFRNEIRRCRRSSPYLFLEMLSYNQSWLSRRGSSLVALSAHLSSQRAPGRLPGHVIGLRALKVIKNQLCL